MNERPYESADLPRVIETYTASIRVLAAPYYTPEQIAAWAPIPPDAARWRERLLTFTPSLPSRTASSQASLPTRSTATWTFSSLIQRSLVTVSPAAFTIASSPRCAPLAPRRLPLLPALPHDPSSTATASNSTARSASSAVALTSDGLPCTSNSAMNESPNQSMQPTARVYVSFLCSPRGRLILCLLNGYALL